MATGRVHRRRGRRVCHRRVDRLSDLPDDLLHNILVRLPSTTEAIRTSVLSRRWRRVWTRVPALSFTVGEQQPPYASSILDGIDAALDAHAAPTLGRLAISVGSQGDPVARVAPWLRFASQRLAGELSLKFTTAPRRTTTTALINPCPTAREEVELPVCGRATAIDLQLTNQQRLRFPAACAGGEFTALRVLRIECFHLHGGDLECALFAQCPRLNELTLSVTDLDGAVSVCSGSLERLALGGGGTGQISVDAPRLARLEMSTSSMVVGRGVYRVQITAPELAEVIWRDAYLERDQIVVTSQRRQRRLRRLEVELNHHHQARASVSGMASTVLGWFDAVDELELQMTSYLLGKAGYEAFMMNKVKLPQCKALKVTLLAVPYKAIILHLLRKCVGITKLNVHLLTDLFPKKDRDQGELPCGDLTTNGITLDFSFTMVGDHEFCLVRMLLMCCGAVLKKVVVHASYVKESMRRRMCETIISLCSIETRVELYAYSHGRYGLVGGNTVVGLG